MVVENLFSGIYKNKTVLLTGHTGFKGSWLALWLVKMGAKVVGYSLEPPTTPNHFDLLSLDMVSLIEDIRDPEALKSVLAQYQPDIVFHLAAQPLVRLSYSEPFETFNSNVMGTLNVLEACRNSARVKAIVNITSDKCYDNQEWVWGYRENDPMGGHDPYSASKGCAELVVSSYRNSFFNLNEYNRSHQVLLASCRAGNVIGGGDWAKDRLMTDIMLSVSQGETLVIRNPNATRPWQHVLEPLSGYLQVGQKLLEGKQEFASGWNFGPSDDGSIPVLEVVRTLQEYWPELSYEVKEDPKQLHEAKLLKLDCSKAHLQLDWKNCWDSSTTFERTVNWYKNYYQKQQVDTCSDLDKYVSFAKDNKISWAQG